MTNHRIFLAATVALALSGPLQAAELTYPPGSRVGLVPLEGLSVVKGSFGFENSDNGMRIALAELPAEAFASIDTAMKTNQPLPPNVPRPESFETTAGKGYITRDSAQENGVKVRRFALVLPGNTFSGYAIVEVPERAAQAYSDEAVGKMLASVALRNEVPVDEQLGLLPFNISDLSGFKTVRTLVPGGAVLLTDGNEDSGLAGAPYMVISIAPVSPGPNDDRGMLAQQLAASIPGLRDARITNAEPVRIGGGSGYETRLEATSAKDDKPVTVVQWLRFGGGATLRIVAGATREEWPASFPRFRAVRDGINPKQ